MRQFLPIAAAFAASFFSVPDLSAEDASGSDFRPITDKEGNEIEARILSVSGDRHMVQIERSDGRTFEIEIIKLSLDDQQRVKNWLKSMPGAVESSYLELTAEPVEKSLSKQRLDGPLYRATWERQALHYQFSILNKATTDAAELSLEYCVLMKDRVDIRGEEAMTEDDPVRWRLQNEGPVLYRRGSIPLPVLKYNRGEVAISGPVAFDSVRVSGGNRDAMEDEAIGVIARVVDSQGQTIAELNELRREYPKLTWEDFESRRDPGETEGSGMLVERVAAR